MLSSPFCMTTNTSIHVLDLARLPRDSLYCLRQSMPSFAHGGPKSASSSSVMLIVVDSESWLLWLRSSSSCASRMMVCDRFEANPSVGVRNANVDPCMPCDHHHQHLLIERNSHRRTSCVDVAKLGDGLARPSMLLLLLYGLAPCCCAPSIDCSPRMLPRLSVVRRSGCVRKLRLRDTCPFAGEDVDARAKLPSGCRTCWFLMAVYMSCINAHPLSDSVPQS